MQLFLTSREIVADCPLTLWNLAGTFDALKKHAQAIRIYTWLLQSKKSAEDDPCWENEEWAERLKTDCVYRLGVCFQKQGKKETAEDYFRQYVDLLLIGIEGSYSLDDAMRQVHGLHRAGKNGGAESELKRAVKMSLEAAGIAPGKGRRTTLPEWKAGELLSGRGKARK